MCIRDSSRQAMIELNVTSSFSYVLDTTVQASHKRLKTVSVAISTNAPTRPSRLFKNIWQHILKSTTDLIRVYSMYSPLRVFNTIGSITLFLGSIPILRFILDYIQGGASGKIQSLIIGSILISLSFNCFALGIIGDLMGKNRNLIEQTLNRLKDR